MKKLGIILYLIGIFGFSTIIFAAPTSTIVQNLILTQVKNATCLKTDSNGLVVSIPCLYSASSSISGVFLPLSLLGTTNQINISTTTGQITLSTPQDIATTSSPTFASGTFTGNVYMNGYFRMTDDGGPAPATNTIAFFATSTHGVSRLTALDENGQPYVIGRDLLILGKNTTGAQINKGQVIMVTGETGDVPDFMLHSATTSIATAMDVVGLAFENIPINGFGRAMIYGLLNMNTSAFNNGDIVYSATSSGALTNIEPPYPYLSEIMGQVMTSGIGNGSILVHPQETHRDEDGEIVNTFKIGDQTTGTKGISFQASTSYAGLLQTTPTAARTWILPDLSGTLAVSSTAPITLGTTGIIGFTNPGFITGTSTAFYPNGTIIPYASTTGVQAALTFPLSFGSTTHLGALAPLSISGTNVIFSGTLDYASTTNVQKVVSWPIPVASTSLTVSPSPSLILSGNTLTLAQQINSTSSPTFASATLSNFSANSILFTGASGVVSQDNTNLNWNDTTNKFTVGSPTLTSGSMMTFNTVQTSPNAGDTADGLFQGNYTLTAATTTDELVSRVYLMRAKNNMTGGGAIQNLRTLNLDLQSAANTSTTNATAIYVESTSNLGSSTNAYGLYLGSLPGDGNTNKYGIYDITGGRWQNQSGFLGIGSSPSFAYPISAYRLSGNAATSTQISAEGASGAANGIAGYNFRIDATNLWQIETDNNASNGLYFQYNGSKTNRFVTLTSGGNLGVGTTTAASKLTVTGGDVYISSVGSGVIFQPVAGTCFRMTLTSGGGIATSSVACP